MLAHLSADLIAIVECVNRESHLQITQYESRSQRRVNNLRVVLKVLGRILKVGVHIFKQGVQGSNVHDLFNPAGPRRSPFFPRKTPTAVQFHAVDVVMLTIH